MKNNIRPQELLARRRLRFLGVTGLLILGSLTALSYGWLTQRDWVSTDDAFVAGHIITLKAQTEGTVVEILTENTREVRQGEVVLRLDGLQAEVALQQAEAELAESVRALVSLSAKVEMLQQRQLSKAALLQQLQHDLQRYQAAASAGAVSAQQLQNTQDRILELQAGLREVQAEKTSLEAQIHNTPIENHPSVEKAKNRVRSAYINYRRSTLVAPVSGYVAKRKVQIGDHVKAGTPLLVIVPLEQLWIEANFLEAQIAQIRPGQAASIRVDALGDTFSYHGHVEGISPGTGSTFALLPTDNATGNFIHIAERVPVRIGLEAAELQQHPLRPGLSTTARINIHSAGMPELNSLVQVNGSAYKTTVYTQDLQGVEPRIKRIIAANL